MQRHPAITRRRIQSFASDEQLRSRLYPRREPVSLAVYSAPDRIGWNEAIRGRYRPARIGEKFGPVWSTHWFKVGIRIPTQWRGEEVHLLWDCSSEACVWQDGQPIQGLTGTSGTTPPIRPEYRLTRSAKGGERLTLYIEVACNNLFGLSGDPKGDLVGILRQAEIATFDRAAWDLLWDFVIVSDAAQHLPPETPRAGQALAAANAMVNACKLDDRRTWPAARALAAEFLGARNGGGQHNASAIGHAHIDTAWLWPLAETRRKCVRTFSTALRYMDDYDDYKFACSQAQQWEWIKEAQPALFRKMKARVKQGRFIPVGGTWVEPDCNIPSGESLVRQFLFGQRFFRKEFGITCTEFWNPDVFGYSGALPQIMRGAGIRFFLTQKLSWNQFNKPASSTFLWEGIDGSRVLTHFPPVDNYNASVTVKEALFSVRNFKDHERSRESCMPFGYGDGGGGPTPDMLERLQRMRDVDGLPRIACRSPREFFERCEADIRDPIAWVGELYFEMHRGTYTTQARNKRDNRRSELLVRDVEFLAAMAAAGANRDGGRTAAYPGRELSRLWKLLLVNQFHDIIPGSSITAVYEDSARHYADILRSGADLREKALRSLFSERARRPGGRRVLAVNTLGSPREEVVELPEGSPSPQRAASGKPLGVIAAPPMGYAVVQPGSAAPVSAVSVRETARTVTLENGMVRAVFRRNGRLASLFDKRLQREAIEPGGEANAPVLFDDHPLNFDAWDVDVFHLEKREEVGPARDLRIVEAGPLRASIEMSYDLSPASRLKQVVSLTAISPRLDFANDADWHERHRFLKVEFPLNIRAPEASYEIQFGHLLRPTHFNTTWDLARFEVCAHRWADLSEPGFGIALLNDCKYGYATHGNVMRLSLLRSPVAPDPVADQGRHTFRYALFPHAGTLREGGVIEEGYRFNVPLLIRKTDGELQERSFFRVSRPNVVIDTVKKAEDSNAVIVRLYEAHGARGKVRFESALNVTSAARCNLLEDEESALRWNRGGVDIEFSPFQIVTLKLDLQR